MAESKVPREWNGARWAMLNTREAEQMANASYFPDYLRLWFFAVANVKANGHLPLQRGHLRYVLGVEEDGVRQPVTSKTVQNAISLAKEKGLLDPRSGALCLRPVRSIVAQGRGEVTPCDRCDRHRRPRASHLRSVS